MKKLFITTVFVIAIVSNSFAAPEMKAKTANKFNQSMNASLQSSKSTDIYKKETVVIEGEKIDMFYDLEGSLIGMSKTFSYDKLPKSALTSLATHYAYPTYELKECIVFENAENEIGYYVSLMKNNEPVVLQIDIYGVVSVL